MKVLTKADFEGNIGKTIKVGRYMVTLNKWERESQSGSWERGFKWTHTTYGVMSKKVTSLHGERFAYARNRKRTVYSVDGGVTWALDLKTAAKTKGKIILNKRNSQEFAFEGIQAINREWEGPSYKWSR